jgi:hypothetical protein
VQRINLMETLFAMTMPDVRTVVYMNGQPVFPAFQLWKGDARSVRWYETYSVDRTEGELLRAVERYPGEPMVVLVSAGSGYVLGEGGKKKWAWNLGTPDEHWRLGQTIACHAEIVGLWHYPGPLDSRNNPQHWVACFGAMVRGMTGEVRGG